MTDAQSVAAYLSVGMAAFGFMAAHDFACGRPVQKRDFHIVLLWPMVVGVALILGMLVFSDITSKNGGTRNIGAWFQ